MGGRREDGQLRGRNMTEQEASRWLNVEVSKLWRPNASVIPAPPLKSYGTMEKPLNLSMPHA